MASCNLSYSGHTSVIKAVAYVYENTISGTTRQVRVVLQVYAADYSGARDAGYSVNCTQSGTNVEVPTYNGFTITGSAQTIFDETFYVSIAKGASTASINLSFSAWLISSSAGTRTISGSITKLNLTTEASTEASSVSLGASSVQMGDKLLISISRDDPSCEHYLTCWFSDEVELEIADYVGTSYAWTVPDLAYLCADKLSETFWIVCYTYLNDEYIGYTEAEVTLTVPDPTTPSIPDSVATMGTGTTITCTRNSTNFTVKLELEFKGTTVSIGSGAIDTKNWTPSYDLAKLIPNLTYATGTLKCTTLNGTATVGTKSVTIQLTVPENDVTKPSFTLDGLVLTPVSSLPEAFAGMYMRGKTGLQAEFTAESTYSTIAEYSITAGNSTAIGNPAVIELLVNEGEVKVTAKVTDARGFSTSVSTTISVLAYRRPSVTPYAGYSEVICERAMDTGELNAKGTYLAIKAGKSFSSVILDGTEMNACKLQYRWKINGAADYCDWIVLLEENSAETEVSLLISDVCSSLSSSYSVEIQAVDALKGEHKLTFAIMTEAVSFVLYDGVDGAGFGKYPEEPHVVDIASHMTLRVRGKLVKEGKTWYSMVFASGVSESIYEYGRKEINACYYTVDDGNHITVAFNCGFSYAGSSIVVNGAAIAEEHRPARAIYTICPVNDRGLALVSVGTDGYIRIEWVQILTDTVLTGSAEVTWIDGYLDYWT